MEGRPHDDSAQTVRDEVNSRYMRISFKALKLFTQAVGVNLDARARAGVAPGPYPQAGGAEKASDPRHGPARAAQAVKDENDWVTTCHGRCCAK